MRSATSRGRTTGCLFDHLGCARKYRWRDGESEGLCDVEIDDELELRWLLYRKIGRLSPFEDSIHIGSGAPIKLGGLDRESHEPVGICNWEWEGIYRGQLVARRKFSQLCAMNNEHRL